MKRKIKKEEEVIYPKKKDVNIKEGRFKTKGVKKGKKKNMVNLHLRILKKNVKATQIS